MSLIRAIPLKDFLSNSLSTSGTGTAFNLGTLSSGQYLYSAMHLTAVSTGRSLVMKVQAASSSGFGSPTDLKTFALTSARGSTWGSRVTVSTDLPWFRASWTLSTAASTAGSWTGLVYVGIR